MQAIGITDTATTAADGNGLSPMPSRSLEAVLPLLSTITGHPTLTIGQQRLMVYHHTSMSVVVTDTTVVITGGITKTPSRGSTTKTGN